MQIGYFLNKKNKKTHIYFVCVQITIKMFKKKLILSKNA